MAKAVMIQGTSSGAGKSLVTAALCRIFRQDGYRVAPFKSQNMALNSFVTADGLEMGRAQVMQAEAAGLLPDVRMNPILLKPTSDSGSQVIFMGKSIGNMSAVEYYAYKPRLMDQVKEVYDSLAATYDIIVLEGAGSPAEINLKDGDIVNMGMARMADAPVLLVGDIDRGGVFAALYGTVKLLDSDEQDRIKGIIINKFRGDVEILKPGLAMLEEMLKIPVTGVVPYTVLDIDDEDSLSPRFSGKAENALIDIAVIRIPRISNFTDFNPLERVAGVSVRYVSNVESFGNPDLVILPGSKNTMGDLLWMRQNGLEAAVKKYAAAGNPVFGVCGGYQMMGRCLSDPEGVENGGTIEGMGLLPTETVFCAPKTTVQVTGKFLKPMGLYSKLGDIPFTGYEIHMGQTNNNGAPLTQIERNGEYSSEGAWLGNCAGTYVHGIFDSEAVTKALVIALLESKGLFQEDVRAFDTKAYKGSQYDLLADVVRNALDMDAVYHMMGIER